MECIVKTTDINLNLPENANSVRRFKNIIKVDAIVHVEHSNLHAPAYFESFINDIKFSFRRAFDPSMIIETETFVINLYGCYGYTLSFSEIRIKVELFHQISVTLRVYHM